MEVYGKDLILGDFRASDYRCILASFTSDGVREEDTGISVEVIEEFVADNPVPVFLGEKHTSKLHPSIVLVKDFCQTDDPYFTERDCRAIIRIITGKRGYQWMKIVTEDIGEDIWYRAKVISVSYQKVSGQVAGIVLDMECDSQFAWSTEFNVTVNATANQPFYVYSQSEDPYSYVSPYVTILIKQAGNLQVTATEDSNWIVSLNDVRLNETIRYDCKNEIIDGSRNDAGVATNIYLTNSNCHFFRLKPDRNQYVSNLNAQFTFTYRYPIKVAFVST